MAVKYPAANGNWSTAANWNGGTLPATGDTVCANGKTIAIDMDLAAYTFVSLTTVATAPAAAGGGFTCSTTGYTINAAIISGNAVCLTISGNITLAINGNITPLGLANGLNSTITGTLTVVGNITGLNYHGLYHNSTGTITVIGNVTGGGGAYGIWNNSTGTVNITGVVLGGTGPSSYGIYNTSTGVNNIIGTVQSSSTIQGIYSVANCNIYVTGIIDTQTPPTAVIPAITLTTGTIYLAALVYNRSTTLAIFAPKIALIAASPTSWQFVDEAAGTKTLYTTDTAMFGYPATGDTRDGTIYGQTNEFEGTCVVPTAANVLQGVPVDATTGTALMTPADFWDYAKSSATTAGSMGEMCVNIDKKTGLIPALL